MKEFEKLNISENILKVIKELGFTKPSEIQEKTIPLALQGKDILGGSATGSGKTLAFGAGIIQGVQKGKGIQALVLTPTRELAEQVARSLREFSKYYNLDVVEIYGGVNINPQIRALQRADIVVGTPGRILDHLSQRTLALDKVRFLVLDEADRMLDMGFIRDVEKIIDVCPRNRQMFLFSATISIDIERMSKKYMKDPIYISVESYVDASKLTQIFYDVPQNKKFSLFVHLLKQEHSGLIMVFCNTRRNTDFLADNLKRYGLHALAIHGGLEQNRRNAILKSFHENEVYILVCTDVAARGLDIQNVSHIYNYDIPKTSSEYIHRIGRTARAGKHGKAINLVSQRDYENFRKVCEDDSLKIKQEVVPEVEALFVNFNMKPRGRFGGGNRDRGHSDSGSRGGYRGGGRGGGYRGSGSRGGSSGGRSFGRRY
ncbi:DEAD/DEAH box helicase [Candidatus Pacearchaeota archaeon]|nr:DEAD/DEAH box helicase [Candidatus Pacearchaeota archaeon]